MAIGKKTGGANFEPGNPGGPGRPALPEDIKSARKMNRTELERVLNEYLFMTKEQIVARVRDPGTPAIEMMIGSIISNAITRGDQQRTNFLLEYIVPKPKESDENKNRGVLRLAYALEPKEDEEAGE